MRAIRTWRARSIASPRCSRASARCWASASARSSWRRPPARASTRTGAGEVGWAPIDFLGAAREPALQGLGAREMLFHWHGDTFDLPRGAVHLASTEVCRHQAFRLGTRLFGLQFHCELDAETIAYWVRDDAAYVDEANGPDGGRQILADTERYFAAAVKVGDRLLGNILDLMIAA